MTSDIANLKKDEFGDLWRHVALDLRGRSFEWWRANEKQLSALGREEVIGVLRALQAGKRHEAAGELVAHMSPEHWRTYVDGTTDQLRGLARRRAELLDSVQELGWLLSRILGRAALDSVLRALD